MPFWPWKAHMRPKALAATPFSSSTSSKPFGPWPTQGTGATGARASASPTGPAPGYQVEQVDAAGRGLGELAHRIADEGGGRGIGAVGGGRDQHHAPRAIA